MATFPLSQGIHPYVVKTNDQFSPAAGGGLPDGSSPLRAVPAVNAAVAAIEIAKSVD
jgi:hypothetical protein